MKRKKKKKSDHPIYDSIRKPTAPPGIKFGSERPAEKVHPSLRKVKHKKEIEEENTNELY